jgi:hypothetical protein
MLRARLAALVVVACCLVMLPAAAQADFKDNTTCRGHVALAPKDPLGLNNNLVNYMFSCSQPITGYSIISDKSVDFWETEVFAHDKAGNPVGTDGFSCNGDQPGFGVNCVGIYGADQRIVESQYNLETDKVCDEPRPDPLLVVTYATYVRNADGTPSNNSDGAPKVTTAVAGPFDLGRPRGCKPSKFSGKTRIPQQTASSPDTATRAKSRKRR